MSERQQLLEARERGTGRAAVAGGLGHKLALHATLKSDVPPHSGIDAAPAGDVAMVLVNECLAVTKSLSHLAPYLKVYHDRSAAHAAEGNVVVERSGVLGDHLQWLA